MSTTRTRRLVTRQQLAQVLDCHGRTISKWVAQGLPVARPGRPGRAARFDETAVRKWLDARAAIARAVRAELDEARARKERAQAVLAEQSYLVRNGDLLPRQEVLAKWSNTVAAVKAKLLAIPMTYADRIHRAGTFDGVRGVEAAFAEAIEDTLRELA